jgi:phosphoserine phosphatase RsbU/P
LIGHREAIAADCPLEQVHKEFQTHQREFMAVLEAGKIIGVCSRHEIGMRLGARYGFALFSRRPVRDYLSAAPVIVSADQPLGEILATVFSRSDESFYDDVVLLDTDGTFLGLIFVHTLVRLQTQFLRDNIVLLEAQKLEIREKNETMEEDLVMAREIQHAMLPPPQCSFPMDAQPGQSGIHIARLYRPAQTVGGDFVHVVELSENAVGIFIADVMGHGVRSALVTAMLRALVQEIGPVCHDPGQLLTQINRDLSAILDQTGDVMFATASYLIADSRAGHLRFGSAGHPHPIHLRRGSARVEALTFPRGVAGPGLCVFKDATYGTAEATLESDDVILLFTDGLIEASDAEGELFGTERLEDALRRHADRDIVSIVEGILAEAEQFTGGQPFEDDVCVVGVNAVAHQAGFMCEGGSIAGRMEA